MNWDRINVWTNTLYTLIHSLELARLSEFARLEDLHKHVVDAEAWLERECSFNSPLLETPFGGGKISFRRDPNKHFTSISQQLVKMIIQDLTVIFDEMMHESLQAHGFSAPDFPQSKIEKLATKLDKQKYDWARKGCLELVAVRNTLTHGNGRWNDKSILIVSEFIDPKPQRGDALLIGVPMLFRYRKAIRTFLNETRV
ncbi:hypothetical protein [Rhizobium leguminosarum]|uniref:hypothetical protein n=1 Tax=Rhizobium leguminosarum TaxID=384 RepID=UPI001C9895C9|nr:hypothetical protein [Rhizobium leguminosarum]MBY5378919.1 hypothetical protein [Rhizobium leguminosarum]